MFTGIGKHRGEGPAARRLILGALMCALVVSTANAAPVAGNTPLRDSISRAAAAAVNSQRAGRGPIRGATGECRQAITKGAVVGGVLGFLVGAVSFRTASGTLMAASGGAASGALASLLFCRR